MKKTPLTALPLSFVFHDMTSIILNIKKSIISHIVVINGCCDDHDDDYGKDVKRRD